MIEYFAQPEGLGVAEGYSHATAGTGRIVAVSGQLAMNAERELVGGSDPLAQSRQVFANLETALRAAGATPADVFKLTIFLTDIADLAAVRAARDEFLGAAPRPASTLVQVTALVVPGACVEIEALAVGGVER
jgi:enamine deaminase RidA (YjgF/YER057c/UK114 family)